MPAALATLLANPLVRALAPWALLALVAPLAVRVFGRDWRTFDRDAHAARAAKAAGDELDLRAPTAFGITAVALTIQQYFGGPEIFEQSVFPIVARLAERHPSLRPDLWHELYGFVWWCLVRCATYVALPLLVWKALFPHDRLRDLGLRAPLGRFSDHARSYALCLVAVAPLVVIASRQRDFAAYYPFYPYAGRSRLDLIAWEALYALQFVALELFFRGFLLATTRTSLGANAIFAMCVPYCMIHYGKPYLEACGATVAGVVLGTLAMRTRSIYGGVVVHIAVAVAMDALALRVQGGVPVAWVPW